MPSPRKPRSPRRKIVKHALMPPHEFWNFYPTGYAYGHATLAKALKNAGSTCIGTVQINGVIEGRSYEQVALQKGQEEKQHVEAGFQDSQTTRWLQGLHGMRRCRRNWARSSGS